MRKVMTYPQHVWAILCLGLPLIGGHLAQVAIGVTDTVMLGWYGVDALAAVTLGSTVFFVLFIFGSGFAWAVMPLVASLAAEGDEVGLRRATRMGLWLSLGFALLAVPVMIWSEPILRVLGQGNVLAAQASAYLRIAGLGLVPALLVMVLKSYLAALERTQVVFWITVLSAVTNGLINYSLIFGNWGAPELGVRGAALASVATQIVALSGVVVYARWALPEHALFQRLWRPDWPMLARVFRLGWPIGLTSLSEVGLFAASAMMMGWLGTVTLAAHGIAIQLASITFMIHVGLSNTATIRAGNAYGRTDVGHMKKGALVVTIMSLVMASLTIVAFLLLPEQLLSFFMKSDEPHRLQILAIGTGLLAMAALFQLVDGAQVIALGLLRGVQDTRVPMIFAAVSYWGVGLPCSYVFGFMLGLEGIGIWLGLVVGLGLAGLLLSVRFWGVALRKLTVPSQAMA
ncbi:MATE family efflux transporter [Roseobacter cerasinus]|uniref:Multidrug-efflux transporter n=1 Tax=Roseobacter cerasinus TaxID=2602289 RepID=A0A640VTV3_9RHOB|nr:MATE family efflux transporter [Roseobacter cerasinus]GFE51459.1 MATE family efflux transporter [Roseobacter cerasinus]